MYKGRNEEEMPQRGCGGKETAMIGMYIVAVVVAYSVVSAVVL